jgi:hypothetical protein
MAAFGVSRKGAKARRNAKKCGRKDFFFPFFLANLGVFAPWRERSRPADEKCTEVHFRELRGHFQHSSWEIYLGVSGENIGRRGHF